MEKLSIVAGLAFFVFNTRDGTFKGMLECSLWSVFLLESKVYNHRQSMVPVRYL